ncbi:hypothetical protein K491DRAFT_782514 [Lophiostoma macrostomum CBS 122681]|uniref:Uncharacterized protein n=1 Tax=Lophiostoma macrostomum CBS 122681 TaxID=1314788 RepID=A0A6A6SS38_9PLEO|nr:hypothetical protein K491DRAFT_782514 [Lophiostoma macrostomum CBS 122681]
MPLTLTQRWQQPTFNFNFADDDDMEQIYQEMFERCKNGTASAADWRDLPADYKACLERLEALDSDSDGYSVTYSDEEEEDTTDDEIEFAPEDWEVRRPCTPTPDYFSSFDQSYDYHDEDEDAQTIPVFPLEDIQPITAITPTKPPLSTTTPNPNPSPLSTHNVPQLPLSATHRADPGPGCMCYCAECAVKTLVYRLHYPARGGNQWVRREFQDGKGVGGGFGWGRSALRGEVKGGLNDLSKEEDLGASEPCTPNPSFDYAHARTSSSPLLRVSKPVVFVDRDATSRMKTGRECRDIWDACPLCEMPMAYVPPAEREAHLTVCHAGVREQNVAWERRKKGEAEVAAKAKAEFEDKVEVGAEVPCIICDLDISALSPNDISLHLEDCICDDDAPITCPACGFELAECETVDEAVAHLKVCQDTISILNSEEHTSKAAEAATAPPIIDAGVSRKPHLASTVGRKAQLKNDGTDKSTLMQLLNPPAPTNKIPVKQTKRSQRPQLTRAVRQLVFTVQPEPETEAEAEAEPEPEIEERPQHPNQDQTEGCMSPVSTHTRFRAKQDIVFGFDENITCPCPSPSSSSFHDTSSTFFFSSSSSSSSSDDDLSTSDVDHPSSASSLDGSEIDQDSPKHATCPADEENTSLHFPGGFSESPIARLRSFDIPVQWPSPLSIATLSKAQAPSYTTSQGRVPAFDRGSGFGFGKPWASPMAGLTRLAWDMLPLD